MPLAKGNMMDLLLLDGIPLLLCLWFIKSYFFHYKMTEEERLVVREAPKWLFYPVTALFCLMLLLLVGTDLGLIHVFLKETLFRYTIVALMLWLALVLYVKWNWGVHVTNPAVKKKNKKQMILLLLLMGFMLTLL